MNWEYLLFNKTSKIKGLLLCLFIPPLLFAKEPWPIFKEKILKEASSMPGWCSQEKIIPCFLRYKNIVLPTTPWKEIVKSMLKSKLVISSSLHGIIVAESFGIPARLLKMTWLEPLLKYQDYYESTGRPDFTYATSVQEALEMGGEKPPIIDIEPLLNSFPWDYFK